MIRNHKPNVGPCECSKCHALTPSAPGDHTHRNCSTVENGVVSVHKSSMTRGTWRRISPDDYALKLAERLGGPSKDELAEQDVMRSVTTLDGPPAVCIFLTPALRDAPIPAA